MRFGERDCVRLWVGDVAGSHRPMSGRPPRRVRAAERLDVSTQRLRQFCALPQRRR